MPPPHRPLSQSHHPNNKICQQPPTPPSLPAQTALLHPPPSPHPQNSSSPPPSLTCKVLQNSFPPLVCKFHTGIYPSSPPDLLPLCSSLPLSCLCSPEVPSPSILPSTLLVYPLTQA